MIFASCGADVNSSSGDPDNCSVHAKKDAASFFDSGDYGFSCMDDDGEVTIEYPVLANNHRIVPQGDDAVSYIMSVVYHETKDRALGSYIFAKTFADGISESQKVIEGLGAEALFYIITADDVIQNYIIFRDCNFVGTITAEYEQGAEIPCNMGEVAFVAYSQEVLRNK